MSTLQELVGRIEADSSLDSLLVAYDELKEGEGEFKKLRAELAFMIAQNYLRVHKAEEARRFAAESIELYREMRVTSLEGAAPILYRYLPDMMHEDVVRDRILSHLGPR